MIPTHNTGKKKIITADKPRPHPMRARMMKLGTMTPAENEPLAGRPAPHPCIDRILDLGQQNAADGLTVINSTENHPAITRYEQLNRYWT